MELDTYLDTVEANGERIRELARLDPGRAIGFLGEWSMRDLLGHTGMVFAFCAAQAGAQSTTFTPPGPESQVPDGDAIYGWHGERLDTLMQLLRTADPEAVSWTFAGVRTVGFWHRRMAMEMLVHRMDAEAAMEQPTPVDAELAVDGIDEYLDIGLLNSPSRADRKYPAESLHLHTSDVHGEWMIVRNEDGKSVTVTHEHGKGDAAARGNAADLLWWIWGRPAVGIEIFGDEDVARAWQTLSSS